MSSYYLGDFNSSEAFSYVDSPSTNFASHDGSGSSQEAAGPCYSPDMSVMDNFWLEMLNLESEIEPINFSPEQAPQPAPEQASQSAPEQAPQPAPEQAKRSRAKNWTFTEKYFFLVLMVKALQVILKGPVWRWISEELRTKHKVNRTADGCEDQWTTLMRPYKKIVTCGREYWDMDADARFARSLPLSFPQNWFQMMETINAAKGKSKPSCSLSTKLGTTAPVDPSIETFIKQEVDCLVSSWVDILRSSPDLTSAKRDGILTSHVPGLKQRVVAAVIAAFLLHPLPNLFKFDDQDGPASDIRNWIKDALRPELQRVADVLQKLAHEEQGDYAKLAAVEEQREALVREGNRLKRKLRPCRSWGGHLKTTSKPRLHRRSNHSTAEEIVAPLQELRIVEEDIMLDGE